MKLVYLLLLLTSLSCCAKNEIDLTAEENETMANLYPEFDRVFYENFSDTGNETVVKLRSHSDAHQFSIYRISIRLSVAGKRRIYIMTPTFCDSTSTSSISYIRTGEKNIAYTLFCRHEQKVLTPNSRQGERYLIDLLNEENAMTVHFWERPITFDAFGFSEAWLSFGGDAL